MEYKIGSFNMERFGANAKKDLAKIAEIIYEEDLDVVAMQEIFSEGKGVKKLLEHFAQHELYDWDICCPDPAETKDFESRGETYAYLWNKKRFKLVELSKLDNKKVFEPRIIKRSDTGIDCSCFVRPPYYIRLQPRYGGFFELRLLNIHIFYGNTSLSSIEQRQFEFKILTEDIYPSISTRAYGQNRKPYTIAMGDYNLNIFTPGTQTNAKNCYLKPIHSYYDGTRNIHILTVQDQLTTLKAIDESDCSKSICENGYANNYDHFTYSPEISNFSKVSVSTIYAIEKYCNGDFSYYRNNISNHLPIVMTINI